MRRSLNLTAGVVCAAVLAIAQQAPGTLLERKLMQRLQSIDHDLDGVLGVAAIDLKSGAVLAYNGETLFPQASSIKIPIMAEVFRQAGAGKLTLDAPVTLKPGDAVGGSGKLQETLRSGPVTVSIRGLVEAMIQSSDNTATNVLIGLVGMDSVNRWITQAGLKHTKLQRRMLESQAAVEDRENVSTPIDMARLAQMLYSGNAGDPAASKEMIEILTHTSADFRAAIPPAIRVAAKYGDLRGVHVETGIIFVPKRPFALSVMSTFLDDRANPIPGIARIFYEHFRKLADSNLYGHNLQ